MKPLSYQYSTPRLFLPLHCRDGGRRQVLRQPALITQALCKFYGSGQRLISSSFWVVLIRPVAALTLPLKR